MNSVLKSSSTRWRLFILAAWAAGSAVLLLAGRYTLFIRAEFWPLLLTSLVILILFLISMFARPDHGGIARRLTLTTWVRGAMILLPLLFMSSLLMGGATLNTETLRNRWIANPFGAAGADDNAAPPASGAVDLGYICIHLQRLAGTHVVTEGRVYHDPALPPGQFAVFRFVMVCCTADAVPVEVPVKFAKTSAFKDDDWVQVSGTVRTQSANGQQSPLIEADKIDRIAAPADPYITPNQY